MNPLARLETYIQTNRAQLTGELQAPCGHLVDAGALLSVFDQRIENREDRGESSTQAIYNCTISGCEKVQSSRSELLPFLAQEILLKQNEESWKCSACQKWHFPEKRVSAPCDHEFGEICIKQYLHMGRVGSHGTCPVPECGQQVALLRGNLYDQKNLRNGMCCLMTFTFIFFILFVVYGFTQLDFSNDETPGSPLPSPSGSMSLSPSGSDESSS